MNLKWGGGPNARDLFVAYLNSECGGQALTQWEALEKSIRAARETTKICRLLTGVEGTVSDDIYPFKLMPWGLLIIFEVSLAENTLTILSWGFPFKN